MLVWNCQDNHWPAHEWGTVAALDAGFFLEARVGITQKPYVCFSSIVLTKSNDIAWNICVTNEVKQPDCIFDGWKTVFLVYFRSLKDTSPFPNPCVFQQQQHTCRKLNCIFEDLSFPFLALSIFACSVRQCVHWTCLLSLAPCPSMVQRRGNWGCYVGLCDKINKFLTPFCSQLVVTLGVVDLLCVHLLKTEACLVFLLDYKDSNDHVHCCFRVPSLAEISAKLHVAQPHSDSSLPELNIYSSPDCQYEVSNTVLFYSWFALLDNFCMIRSFKP